jgi:hypothetical protein
MQPHEVIREAVKGHVKAVALRMGKSEDYVYKMLANPQDCRYTRFLAAFIAIYEENPIGGEAVFEHFRAIVLGLREQSETAKGQSADYFAAVRKTVRESSEAIEAAIEGHDPIRLQKEITEAIDALRKLNRLSVARETAVHAAAGGMR